MTLPGVKPLILNLPTTKLRARPGKKGWPAQGWTADGNGLRVVALGDSVTYGVGDECEHDADSGWASYVAYAVGASYYLNVARMGARARTITQEQIATAVAAKPDVALVLVGGNDVLRGDFRHKEVRDHVTATIRALQAVGATVLLLRLHDPRRTLPFHRVIRETMGRRIDRANRALDAAAAATSCVFVNLTDDENMYDARAWHVDRMHVGPNGHRYVAGVALDALIPSGYARQREIPPPELAPPDKHEQLMWLIKRGTPWLLRRSIDLIPALLIIICYESARARWESWRRTRTAGK